MTRCRTRDVHWLDLVAIVASALLILAVFALDLRVADHRQSRGLPVRVFWVGVVLGVRGSCGPSSTWLAGAPLLARRP